MKIAIDVGRASFGTEKQGRVGRMNSTSQNCAQSDKIPLVELDKALDLLGERGKKSLMAYIKASNPKTSDEYIQVQTVDSVLQTVFGEASVLLMKEILHQ